MSRNGQVYFVNSRISNIENLAALIQREVPTHASPSPTGSWHRRRWSRSVIDFGNHEYDVLVATKIIEMYRRAERQYHMIHDAHHYGLSELQPAPWPCRA